MLDVEPIRYYVSKQQEAVLISPMYKFSLQES